MEFNLKNKKALVTGGSRGIGKSIVNILEKNGATVISTSTKDVDFADEISTRNFIEYIETLDIDICVNNAGICINNYIDDIPFEDNELNFIANVSAYTGNIDAVELYYNLGDGFTSQEMELGFGGNYQTAIGGLYNGMLIEYYIMAVNSEGIVQTFPSNAPDNTILFVVIHELAHVMTEEIGHPPIFWENMKYLLEESEKFVIY